MTKIKLAYIQEFVDRHGTVRKAGCKTVMLPGAPGSDEFMEAYQRALASLPKAAMKAFNLCADYRLSQER